MEKPTPEKTLLTPKEAVDYAAHYLNISREEAGKLLAEERPLNAQIYFERDPMGVDYLSHPGKEGYCRVEMVRQCFLKGENLKGRNLLFIGAKRFFLHLKTEMECPLDFDLGAIQSHTDFHQDMRDGCSELRAMLRDEQETANILRQENETLKAENTELKKENGKLRNHKTTITHVPYKPRHKNTEWEIAGEVMRSKWDTIEPGGRNNKSSDIKDEITRLWIATTGKEAESSAIDRIDKLIRPDDYKSGRYNPTPETTPARRKTTSKKH